MSPPGRSGSGTAGDNNWREQPLSPTTGYIRDTQFNEMSDMPPQVGDPDPDSRPRPRTYVARAPPPCAPDARPRPRDDGDERLESRAGSASHGASGARRPRRDRCGPRDRLSFWHLFILRETDGYGSRQDIVYDTTRIRRDFCEEGLARTLRGAKELGTAAMRRGPRRADLPSAIADIGKWRQCVAL
jgi:hypothetical protein